MYVQTDKCPKASMWTEPRHKLCITFQQYSSNQQNNVAKRSWGQSLDCMRDTALYLNFPWIYNRCMPVPFQWIHHWPSMVLSMMQGGVWSTATTIYVAFFTDTGEVRTENNSTVNTKSDNWTTIFLSIQIKYGQLRACFAASSGEQSFEEEYCLLQSFDRAIRIVKTQSEMRRASPLLFNLPVYWQLSQHPPSRQKYQLSMSLVE